MSLSDYVLPCDTCGVVPADGAHILADDDDISNSVFTVTDSDGDDFHAWLAGNQEAVYIADEEDRIPLWRFDAEQLEFVIDALQRLRAAMPHEDAIEEAYFGESPQTAFPGASATPNQFSQEIKATATKFGIEPDDLARHVLQEYTHQRELGEGLHPIHFATILFDPSKG